MSDPRPPDDGPSWPDNDFDRPVDDSSSGSGSGQPSDDQSTNRWWERPADDSQQDEPWPDAPWVRQPRTDQPPAEEASTDQPPADEASTGEPASGEAGGDWTEPQQTADSGWGGSTEEQSPAEESPADQRSWTDPWQEPFSAEGRETNRETEETGIDAEPREQHEAPPSQPGGDEGWLEQPVASDQWPEQPAATEEWVEPEQGSEPWGQTPGADEPWGGQPRVEEPPASEPSGEERPFEGAPSEEAPAEEAPSEEASPAWPSSEGAWPGTESPEGESTPGQEGWGDAYPEPPPPASGGPFGWRGVRESGAAEDDQGAAEQPAGDEPWPSETEAPATEPGWPSETEQPATEPWAGETPATPPWPAEEHAGPAPEEAWATDQGVGESPPAEQEPEEGWGERPPAEEPPGGEPPHEPPAPSPGEEPEGIPPEDGEPSESPPTTSAPIATFAGSGDGWDPALDGERRRATTAEQAVPWMIGIILALAGIVIVLLALIFTFPGGLIGSASPSPTPTTPVAAQSGEATPSVQASASEAPTATPAPTPTPTPVPAYGPLEMVYLGRPSGLAPIYLLRRDFSVDTDPEVMAQAEQGVSAYAWSPDGRYGAAIIAGRAVGLTPGEAAKALADNVSAISWGWDSETLYAVRITRSGGDDSTAILKIDFASAAVDTLATITYPHPVTAPDPALKEAQFIDDGGLVRLYAAADGNLVLWVLGAPATYRIDPGDGKVTEAAGRPTLWAPDGRQRIVLKENSDGTSVLTLTSTGGEALASTKVTGLVSHIRWAPESNEIVFTLGHLSNAGGVRQDLYVWDLVDAKAPSALTSNAVSFGATWVGVAPNWMPATP